MRASKGTIQTQELACTRRFKYTYQGKYYYLTLPQTPRPGLEGKVAEQIRKDIVAGCHDGSGQKYREMLLSGNNPLVEDLELFLSTTGRSLEKNIYYHCYCMVKKWGDIPLETIPSRLVEMRYKSSTFNSRKTVLNAYLDWKVRRGELSYNPMKEIPSRRRVGGKDPARKWIDDKYVWEILEAIRTDRFSPHPCRWKHSHYYPIFYFLALTGVRPAEAIGLQVKKLSFSRREIRIDQALARTRKGTSAKNRVMKATKMEDSRLVPMSLELESILREQVKGRKGEDLVFPGPGGKSCDDRKMGENVLASVLKGLEMEHKVLYFFRHSFISRCFQQGMDVKSVQALTGHKDVKVLLEIYAEVTSKKPQLPSLHP